MIDDDDDFDPYAQASTYKAVRGTRKDKYNRGRTAYARACLMEAEAGLGRFASARASAYTASAHATYGLDNKVGAEASLVKVEGNLGPIKASRQNLFFILVFFFFLISNFNF